MARFVGLLRGINVGGHNKVPMAALRDLCAGLGWSGVETYIQSGNLVFEARGKVEALEVELERVIEERFDVSIAVIVRSGAEWEDLVRSNPFTAEAKEEPERVLLGISKTRMAREAAGAIAVRAAGGERVVQAGEALWFHYPQGLARTKLTPALIDRAAGSPVTARNWRTVLKLQEMLA
jgi:uncharacterized protein (DUF1697 family)